MGTPAPPATPELSIRAQMLEEGGPPLWQDLMDELRSLHLGAPEPKRSVLTELRAAFESMKEAG